MEGGCGLRVEEVEEGAVGYVRSPGTIKNSMKIKQSQTYIHCEKIKSASVCLL